LRTSCDLARLWHSQGRSAEALSLVGLSYGRFSEGFGTAELRDALTLMGVLRLAIHARQAQRSEPGSELDADLPASAAVEFDGTVAGGARWASELSFSEAARRTSH
jgi:hypothetical protein